MAHENNMATAITYPRNMKVSYEKKQMPLPNGSNWGSVSKNNNLVMESPASLDRMGTVFPGW